MVDRFSETARQSSFDKLRMSGNEEIAPTSARAELVEARLSQAATLARISEVLHG
ncbi:hypothetical protein [Novosphingobium beihaiensis]|uniref:Uncharacterized protein n=1 Tax=Novosphingobium beihaiensis TaxID=2930389 RepID=A0ABT0BP18_9SPHN|nr:hypothetical protein [Novosphingobium beihaiensis]MCJ2186789.1 hypothetical protein [Novosphingobium beihaiensis]